MDPTTNNAGGAPAEGPNYLDMSDEEVMNLSAPENDSAPAVTDDGDDQDPSAQAGADGKTPAAQSGEPAADGGQNDGGAAAGGTGEDGEGGDAAAGEGGEGGKPAGEPAQTPEEKAAAEAAAAAAAGKPATPGAPATPAAGAKPGEEGKPATPAASTNPTPATPAVAPVKALADYTPEEKAKEFDKIMAPFKANDRTIELRSPEEAVKLMQMGANYTKKMQALQPQLRTIKMLENNGLLDENKLAFAIDLMAGKPLAIQKLLADTQFDPMGADKDKAADYKPGNHQVSDAEMAFNSTLDELQSTESGKTLIAEVAGQWDAESKQVLFQHPDVLLQLNQQKDLGLYQQITSEVDRLKALGQIPQGTPFLQAYRAVGDMLHSQGRLKGPEGQVAAPQGQEVQAPVEERVVTPPAQVTNADRARAAAPTKSAPAAAKTDDDVLGLPDDEFLKQMQGRL